MSVATTHGSAHDARPPQMARYRDLVSARHAIEELEAHGVDGDDIALVGEGAVAAEHETRHVERDARVLGSVTRSVVGGALLGALVAAPIGALCVGLVVVLWPGGIGHPWWAFAFVSVWFTAAGIVFGGFAAVSRRTAFSESWEATFGDSGDAAIWLAVYRDDDNAHAVLEETHPIELRADRSIETRHPDETPTARS